MTLQGSEWITYIIYDSDGKAHSPVNKVALEFKVREINAIMHLATAAAAAPAHCR